MAIDELSEKQLWLIRALADRHGLSIPLEIMREPVFGRKFLNLFAFDPDKEETTGFRRVSVIESYLYYDKDQSHLQFKLEMTQEEVAFMVDVLATYKYGGALPREEDESDRDPEDEYYEKVEKAAFLAS